jgi:hypothetical protein
MRACCAPTATGVGSACTASVTCVWGAQMLTSTGPCPPEAPDNGTMCGSNALCSYCTTAGLIFASCLSVADTSTWRVSIATVPQVGHGGTLDGGS